MDKRRLSRSGSLSFVVAILSLVGGSSSSSSLLLLLLFSREKPTNGAWLVSGFGLPIVPPKSRGGGVLRSVVASTTVSPPVLALAMTATDGTAENDEGTTWENLVPSDATAPVRKTTVATSTTDQGQGQHPSEGSVVAIEYTGKLVLDAKITNSMPSWTTEEVLECWLKEQQGLYDVLSGPFLEHSVDGSKLLDEESFTEDYVSETLGVTNKIQCKKTIMAAKRLRTTLADFDDGSVFDSTASRKDGASLYEFVLGAGKTIRAMELLVASMTEGERARVVARSDYGYGSDGCRTNKGNVMVPPFCGLEFDVRLVRVGAGDASG